LRRSLLLTDEESVFEVERKADASPEFTLDRNEGLSMTGMVDFPSYSWAEGACEA
jgi:hypothetical protein